MRRHLADHGHEVISDEDFAHLYAKGKGRPSVPPSVMVRAMMCATHDRTSDAETSRRTRVDSDWKAAMGVDDLFEGIGATTFSLMRARLVAHDADNALFEKTLEQAVQKGVFKEPLTAVIDSSPVHGAGAVASTYELVRKMMGRLARAMGGRLDAGLTATALELAAAKPDIDWQGPAVRKAHLGELLELAATLLGVAAADKELADDAEVAEAAELLSRVVLQDVGATEDGPAVRQGVAPDRVVSHSGPEMRHGRKSASRRFDGHKLDVMIDEASELVLGVDVRAGNAGDGEGAAPLLSKVTAVEGIEVGTLLGDMAYSDGDVREAVEEAVAELVAKVPPGNQRRSVPQDRLLYRPNRRTGHLPRRGHHRRCPAGQGPQGPAGHHVLFPGQHLCHLPAPPTLHRRARRAHHHGGPPPKAVVRRGPVSMRAGIATRSRTRLKLAQINRIWHPPPVITEMATETQSSGVILSAQGRNPGRRGFSSAYTCPRRRCSD